MRAERDAALIVASEARAAEASAREAYSTLQHHFDEAQQRIDVLRRRGAADLAAARDELEASRRDTAAASVPVTAARKAQQVAEAALAECEAVLVERGAELKVARAEVIQARDLQADERRMRAFLENNGPWDQLVRLGNVALRTLTDGVEVVLSPQLKVTPVAVPHRDEYSETVGFVVQGPRRRALYLPDIDKWSRWDRPIESLVRAVDRAWLDGTFFDDNELPGRDMSQIPHPFIVESMARLAPLPPADRAKVHFVHFNHTNPVLDPSSKATQSVEAAGHQVAREGDRFEL